MEPEPILESNSTSCSISTWEHTDATYFLAASIAVSWMGSFSLLTSVVARPTRSM